MKRSDYLLKKNMNKASFETTEKREGEKRSDYLLKTPLQVTTVNNYFKSINSFSQQMADDFKKRDGVYQSAESFGNYRDDTDKRITSFSQQSKGYRDYFSKNREMYGDETVNSILSSLDEVDNYLSGARSGMQSEYDYWSSFESEREYTDYQDYEKAKKLDVDATNKRLEEIGSELSGLYLWDKETSVQRERKSKLEEEKRELEELLERAAVIKTYKEPKVYTPEEVDAELAALTAELKQKDAKFTEEYYATRTAAEDQRIAHMTREQHPSTRVNSAHEAMKHIDEEKKAWKEERAGLEKKIKDFTRLQRLNELKGYRSAEDFEQGSQYVSTKNNKEAEDINSGFLAAFVNAETPSAFDSHYTETGYNDDMYEYINGTTDAITKIKANERSNGQTLWGTDWSYLDELTDEERKLYNYIHEKLSRDEAREYISLMEPELLERQRERREKLAADYAYEHPFAASFGSMITSPTKGISYAGQALDYISSGEIDPNAGYNRFVYMDNATRGAVSDIVEEKWGQAGTFFYNTGMSMGDFLFSTAITGGYSSAALAIMGSGAAASTTLNALDRGLSSGRAFTLGTIAGAAEIMTERISLDALFDAAKLGKSAVGYLWKNTISEGAEEGISGLANLFADVLISQDKSEWQQSIDLYKAMGKSESEAFGLAFGDQAKAIGLDVLGGGLSGFAMASVPAAVQGYVNRKSQNTVAPMSDLMYNQSNIEGSVLDGQGEVDNGRDKWFHEEISEKSGAEGNSSYGKTETGILEQGSFDRRSGESLFGHDSEGREISDVDSEKIRDTVVKDESGRPKAVYHYTPEMEFTTFGKSNDIGFHFGNEDQTIMRKKDLGTDGGRTFRVYLNLKNPIKLSADIMGWKAKGTALKLWSDGYLTEEEKNEIISLDVDGYDSPAAVRLREMLTEKGYDGIVYPNGFEGDGDSYIAFSDEQIIKTEIRNVSEDTSQATASTPADSIAEAYGATGVEKSAIYSAYELGRQNTPRESVPLEGPAQEEAYNAGRIEYIRNMPKETSAGEKTKVSGEGVNRLGENNNGQEIHLRRGGERDNGSDTSGEVRFVEEGSRRNKSRDETSRPADSEAASLTLGEKVSPASQGIARGSRKKNIRLVKYGNTEATRAARKIAKERGLRLVLFAGGNLEINGKNGEIISARAYISGDRVFVRADHPFFTAEQLMRHEAGHDMIAKGEIDLESVRERIGEDAERVTELYSKAYEGSKMTADEIFEEIVCDSLGDMNIFAETFDENEAEQFLDETSSAVLATKTESQQGRAPPVEAKFSREYWKSDLSKSQMERLLRWVKHDIKTSTNRICETANWTFREFDGVPILAIYSTENQSDPTVLYEVKGEQAELERDYLELMEEINDGQSIIGKSGVISTVLSRSRVREAGSHLNDNGAVGRDGSGGNVGVLRKESKSKPSAAFKNVLRNLFQDRGKGINGKTSDDVGISNSVGEGKFSREVGGRTERYSLRDDAEAEVEKAISQKGYTNEVKLTDSSPSILSSQKGVKNLPMVMKSSHIRENVLTESEAQALGLKVSKNINYHGLGKKLFLKVISGLDDVSEAYRGTPNAENPERRENYFLLISKCYDSNGDTINVPVYVNEHALYNRVFIDTNKVATVFGRKNFRTYIKNQVEKGNLVKIKNRSLKASESPSPIDDHYSNDASDKDDVSLKTKSNATKSSIPGETSSSNSISNFNKNVNGKTSLDLEVKNSTEEQASLVSDVQDSVRAAVREELNRMGEEYGWIPKGEKAAREVNLPKKTAKDKYVSQTVRTILEAEATPEDILPDIEELVANGEFSYERYTDKEAIADAKESIKRLGWDEALKNWTIDSHKKTISKEHTALGWALYNNAVNSGNTATAISILDGMIANQRSAAQALQATRILKKLSPETQLYQVQKSVARLQEEINERYRKKKAPELVVSEELGEAFLNAETQEERDEVLKDIYVDIGRQMPSNWVDKFLAYRYLSMLCNTRTHIRNILGNLFFTPVVAVKNLTATAIEKAVYTVSGGKIERTKGFSRDFDKLLAAAWKNHELVADEILGKGKYGDGVNEKKAIEEGRVIFDAKGTRWIDKLRKTNSKAFDFEDTCFAKPHYAFALAQYAAANGISAEQIQNGDIPDSAYAYAIKEAKKATYRDVNAFSQFVSSRKPKSAIGKVAKFAVDTVLPFKETPANILVRGLEYSPAGILYYITYGSYQVAKGDMSAAELIDGLSAGLTGTGLMALGFLLGAFGRIRGHGSDDEEKRKFEEMMGYQAYSWVCDNGETFTLDWLAPEALPFFAGVNLYEVLTEKRENDEQSGFWEFLGALGRIGEPMLEMSCLQSVNSLFEAVGYASSNETSPFSAIGSDLLVSRIMQLLPTLGGQIERLGEDVRYMTYTEKGKGKLPEDIQYSIGKATAKIPGIDYHQIPYIDAWGRTEKTGGFIARAYNNFLNPAYTSTVNESHMEKELLRLYEATGENSVFPDRATKTFTVNKKKKHLSGEEYVKYATQKGQTSRKVIEALVKNTSYKAASDKEKAKMVKFAYEYANEISKAKVSDYTPDKWALNCQKAKRQGISEDMFIALKVKTGEVESLKDSEGETITNSESLLKMQQIYSVRGISDKQRQILFESFGVGKSVRKYNKALVDSKLKRMKKGYK